MGIKKEVSIRGIGFFCAQDMDYWRVLVNNTDTYWFEKKDDDIAS
jgi:hypothetical protein